MTSLLQTSCKHFLLLIMGAKAFRVYDTYNFIVECNIWLSVDNISFLSSEKDFDLQSVFRLAGLTLLLLLFEGWTVAHVSVVELYFHYS